MFEKVLETEMLEAEIKKLNGDNKRDRILFQKEIEVWKKKVKDEKLRNEMIEFEKEDERGQHLRFKSLY